MVISKQYFISESDAALGLVRDGERLGIEQSLTEKIWASAGDHLTASEVAQMFESIIRRKDLQSFRLWPFKNTPLIRGVTLHRQGARSNPFLVLLEVSTQLSRSYFEQVRQAVIDPGLHQMPQRYEGREFTWSEFTRVLRRTLVDLNVADSRIAEAQLAEDLGL